MPKVREADIVPQRRDRYPGNHEKVTAGYEILAVGDAVGLSQFGVNKVTVKPGAATALNHWHENGDEFVIVLSGEVVLVEGGIETPLKAGECAGFKVGNPVGHNIINKSSAIAIIFEVALLKNMNPFNLASSVLIHSL